MVIKKYVNYSKKIVEDGDSNQFITLDDVKFIKGKTYLVDVTFKIWGRFNELNGNDMGTVSAQLTTSVSSDEPKEVYELKEKGSTEMHNYSYTFISEFGDGIEEFGVDFTVFNDYGARSDLSKATIVIQQID